MDDHRPVQISDPDHRRRIPYSSALPATTGEHVIEPSPPFRSGRVILDDGRSVGLTEPSGSSDAPSGAAWSINRTGGRWGGLMAWPIPAFLRSSWGGVGAWLGAVTVVGMAAMMFGPNLADLAGEGRPSESVEDEDGALGLGIGGGAGALTDDQRGSRARTTGELIEEAGPAGPAANASGRSSGPSDGPDLDLGSRSGTDPVAAPVPSDNGSAPAAPAGGAATPAPTPDPGASTDGVVPGPAGTAAEASAPTTSTTRAMSFPGSEPPTTASPITIDEGGVEDGDEGPGDWPGSIPPGSTSVPNPGTLPPPPLTVPVPVTLPPSTVPPSPPPPGGPPITSPARPPVTTGPPTTRKPVPADTRPSQGGGQTPGRGRSGETPAASRPANGNGSNGRAVGRPQ